MLGLKECDVREDIGALINKTRWADVEIIGVALKDGALSGGVQDIEVWMREMRLED